jgi:cytochrome c-type biogenesis protein CcmH/NrfF
MIGNTRLRTVGLLFVVAGLSLPQNSTSYATPEVRRVADRLACKCGGCVNTVGNCPMLGCHYSVPAREKISKQEAEGVSDQAIIDGFVKEIGIAALAAPPAQGFNLVGWVMPFVAATLGLAVVLLYVRRLRKPAVATTTPAPEIDEKYRKQIEADLAEME